MATYNVHVGRRATKWSVSQAPQILYFKVINALSKKKKKIKIGNLIFFYIQLYSELQLIILIFIFHCIYNIDAYYMMTIQVPNQV